jgi:hypothetical protein
MLARRIQRLVRGGGSAPNLVVAQRVIDKMASAADATLEDETGEAMVGVVTPSTIPGGVPTIYILDTIAPDETAVRKYAKFEQGDDRQGDLFQWLYTNWEYTREKGRTSLISALTNKWDVPLLHVGDWHKQPGYMIHPSGGDLMTALDYLDDDGVDFLVAPIVTLDHPTTIDTSGSVANFVLVSKGSDSAMRVDFWYIDRHTMMFAPMMPAIYPDDQLPSVAPYPWHLSHPKAAEEEFGLMQDDGLALSITYWNADGEAPYEVCLLIGRVGSPKLLILITPADFPKHKPGIRAAPFIPMGSGDDMQAVFEKAWAQSEPIDLTYDHDKYKTLLAYIHAAEDKLGITRTSPTTPPLARLGYGLPETPEMSNDPVGTGHALSADGQPATTTDADASMARDRAQGGEEIPARDQTPTDVVTPTPTMEDAP